MAKFNVLTRDQAKPEVKGIFDVLKSKIGMVPNLYAFIGHSAAALPAYLAFDEALGKGVFTAKERQAIFLSVSQVNQCHYCQSAHTALARMNGFTEDETIKLRTATIDDKRLRAITSLAAEITQTHGKPSEKALQDFLNSGFDAGGLVELIAHIGYKTVANYVHNIAQFPIDFPVASELDPVTS